METWLDKKGFEKYCRDIPFSNKFIAKKPNSGGGLTLLWKVEAKVDVINFTENHTLAKVVKEDGFQWYLTCFYGWLEHNHKVQSWPLLSHLLTFVDRLWLCIGDFNAILHSIEKQSLRPPLYNQMDGFWTALERCNLVDLGFWATHSLGIISDLDKQTQGSD